MTAILVVSMTRTTPASAIPYAFGRDGSETTYQQNTCGDESLAYNTMCLNQAYQLDGDENTGYGSAVGSSNITPNQDDGGFIKGDTGDQFNTLGEDGPMDDSTDGSRGQVNSNRGGNNGENSGKDTTEIPVSGEV
jgi:hypothetical protein